MPPNSTPNARAIAALAIAEVKRRGQALEDALSQQDAYASLEPRDRAFARLLATSVFRHNGQIEAVLKPLLRKAPPAEVAATLQTGVAQLFVLGTPSHAAVGETVEAMKALGQLPFVNLANAVMRRASEDGKARFQATPPKANLPGWLRGAWESAYGAPEMRRIAAQLLKAPPLDLSVKQDADGWAERLGGQVLPSGTVRLPTIGDITALEGFSDGAWWAQDVAASLPVKMLDIRPGMRVLDLCAAPGGKTLQLAALGADVTAVDISEARMERVRQNLERTGLKADVVVADALQYEAEPFDAVLLDAPCSATGTLRRHPDVLFNKTAKQVSQLVKLQRRLLARACDLVAPGGQLLYAVCSLQGEEGPGQLPHLAKHRPDFRLNPTLTTTVSKLPQELFSGGALRSLPHHLGNEGGMDGFFAARFTRAQG